MQKILGRGVAIDSDIDAAGCFLLLVDDLVGASDLQTGVPAGKDVFRLGVVEGRDDFGIPGEQGQEDDD